ncbi:very-short-patch-repair endonuclease [Nocardia sp. GAS34]|uniref:hypothetical protein n=1 Tax=unclassified Nocardia TaxID=2637762 RepID=UPI003D1B63BD
MTNVTPYKLRRAIAEALWEQISAHHLAEVCDDLGMPPSQVDLDPFSSKRAYVDHRLQDSPLAELAGIARRVAADFTSDHVQSLLDALGAHGVSGELKNLIFAADGPKPRIVLRDAVNNILDIVENEQYCLVYNRPLTDRGLTWRELVGWWAEQYPGPATEREHALGLYDRLVKSLDNKTEKTLFRAYSTLYARPDGFDLPALIPQVYLHYDPYTKRQLGNRPNQLERQRMDFLLLLPHRRRIVIEVDGRQHYASRDGIADPALYSTMVAEDRRIKLAGYEVFRFGGHELTRDAAESARLLDTFFLDLLDTYGALPQGE